MRFLTSTIILLFMLVLPTTAQNRNIQLTIEVTSVEGDNLEGQPLTLRHTGYQVSYGSLKLNAEGVCKLKIYAGDHNLSVVRDGFETVSYDFTVADTETEKTVSVVLSEKTRTPFALTAKTSHDVFTGKNNVSVTWNREAPAFFDDFESYSPFAVSFGEWTGIDADLEVAAPLVGTYPNRGVMQYAQIINPLTVTPTWWYDYPILRPYSGQQYVGFTRTSSGNQNDDWLISPAITVGTDNVLQFMGKAADRFPERFMVYVTEKIDNPQQTDFVRIDKDNFETADYTGWHQYSYDLSQYAGRTIKFAIRYISHYNYYGAFMLMVDDVYVGQEQLDSDGSRQMARRLVQTRKSPANPNERFNVYLDNQFVGTTEGYDYTFDDVASGNHTFGIQALYIKAKSEMATQAFEIPAVDYAHVTFHVTANSLLSADGQQISVTSLATTETYQLTVVGGKAEIPSLPKGQYVVNVAKGAFNEYLETITVSGDATIDIELSDQILQPYNITADADDNGNYTLRWNQDLIFSDSFEDYADFATGSFGEWLSIDKDQMPVYPIALGAASNIVSFPGSGTGSNPKAIAPMVFNPWNTTPAMLPTDPAIAAPTGEKTVIFFSAQQARNDKWLISPPISIHENYQLSLKAKGYSSMYPESMEFCVSEEGSTNPSDFTVLSTANPLGSEQWTLYTTDLSQFVGKTVRLAVHYTSNDAFLAQIDDFTVGPESGQGEIVDYGNVVRFDIYLDGEKVGESQTPTFVLSGLSEGSHVVGIRAIYKNGESELVEYVINVATGISHVSLTPTGQDAVWSLSGQFLGQSAASLPAGVYLMKKNGKTIKIRK